MRQLAVHLFVFDSMADWEPALAVAAINNPQFQQAPGRFRVVTVGLTREPVTTMGGIRILPETTLAEISPVASSMLILPGGEIWETGANRNAIATARSFVATGVPVAAICAATLALARAGLLDNRRHTGNDRESLAVSGYRGRSLYVDGPAVTDKHVITASGIAPVDFAREIIRALRLYNEDALDAWYALFKHGDTSRYYDLVRSAA